MTGSPAQSLACIVTAESYAPGLPTVRLSILPLAVLHNCTPLALALEIPGGARFQVPANASVPFDWEPLRARPRKLFLGLPLVNSPANVPSPTAKPIAIDAPGEALLALPDESDGKPPAAESPPVVYLAVRVETVLGPERASSETGGGAGPASGGRNLEELHLTVTPGLFFSNATAWDVQLELLGALGLPRVVPCSAGQNLSLLQRWIPNPADTGTSSDDAAAAAGRPGIRVSFPERGAAGVAVASELAEMGVTGQHFLGGHAEEPINPLQASGRRRLHFAAAAAGPGAEPSGSRMLTYRVCSSRGRMHVVVWTDRQPPYTLQNATGAMLHVGYFLPLRGELGEVHFGGAAASSVDAKPGETMECDFLAKSRGEAGAGFDEEDEREDETSFLEWLSSSSFRPDEDSRPVLKFKWVDDDSAAWSDPVYLEPGVHTTGTFSLLGLQCIMSILAGHASTDAQMCTD